MTYLKVWTSFRKSLEPYTDAEKGRLFVAMLVYAESGEEPDFRGNERYLWPTVKQTIDLTRETSEKRKVSGSAGGSASSEANESKHKQTQTNDSKPEQEEATLSYKEKKRKEKESKEREFIDDDDARAIQGEQDRVLDAASDAGFMASNSVRAGLIRLYAENGLQKVLDGIASCVKHGAPNLAYLEACMRGEPKKPRAAPERFPQRDYSGVQDELIAGIAEELKAGAPA